MFIRRTSFVSAVKANDSISSIRYIGRIRTVKTYARTKYWDDECGGGGGGGDEERQEDVEDDVHLRQARARLERSLGATPPRVTAENIRMAMFRRCRGRVYKIELRKLPPTPGLPGMPGVWLTIVGDTKEPETDTLNYMRGLAKIAQEVSDLGVVHLVLRAIDGLPSEGLDDGDERSVRLM